MLNNNNRFKKQHDDFKYLNRPIVPALAADNKFHSDMYNIGAKDGRLVTTSGKPLSTSSAVDICEMVTEFGKLDSGVALFSAEELRQSGLPLPAGVERRYKQSLIHSYMLNSCLCYCEISTKNGKESFYTTKSYPVLSALSENLANSDKKKKIENFQAQLTTSHMELHSNIFEVIKLQNDRDGLRLSKCRVNGNAKGTIILPLYSVGNYIDYLIHSLSNNRVMMTYLEDGNEYKMVTSLRSDAITKWLKTIDRNEVTKVQNSWQNNFSFGELILPNLLVFNEMVTVQVLDITSIHRMD